ncbi:TonB-dependent hemoglobin/transferrin/lactoferrin family receptor [Neorhizobium alkalisoli]|nr:TonB-dependent hemoglobin/transferrin/lactoferrin family receptor [Neorhizobium alkalisoli]
MEKGRLMRLRHPDFRQTVSMLALLGAFSVPADAFAQDAAGQDGDQSTELETIVLTSTKTGERVYDTLSGSSGIGDERLNTELQGAAVSQIVTVIPGVSSQTSADDPGTAINMRGLQDFGRVNVLVDGARQNFQKNGHEANGTFYIDTQMLKSVDVTRGPSSTIYGSGAIGGVVNFTTIDADDVLLPGATTGGRVRTGFDTNGYGPTVHAEAATKIDDVADFLIAGTLFKPDDYKSGDNETVQSSQYLRSGLAKVRIRPTDDQEFSFSGSRYANSFENFASSVRPIDVTVDSYTAGYRYTPADSDFWDLSAKVYYTDTLSDQGAAGGDTGQSFDVGTLGFDIFNTSKFDTGPLSHELTYGGDFFRDRVKTVDEVGSSDDLTPSGRRIAYGAYLQDKVSFDNWLEVIGALRYDAYKLENDKIEIDGKRLSPKITVGVTPWDPVTFYATYAEGYRAPALTETLIDGFHPPPVTGQFFPNPDLKPEVAHTIEAGVNLRFNDVIASDKLLVKLGVFQNDVDDYIDQVFHLFPIPGGYQYENIAEARIKGFEFEASYDAGRVFAGLSGQILDGVNRTTGDTLQKVPPFRAVTTLGFRAFDDRLTAGTRLTVVGKKDDDVSTGFIGEAYQLVDVFADFAVDERMSVNVQLNNIFDRQYTQYLNADPSPGFNAKAFLTMRF